MRLVKRLAGLVLVSCALSTGAVAAQQVKLEAIVKRVNDDFVTLIDVRRARLLRLVEPATLTDDEVAMRLVERKLELDEVDRAAPKEVTPQAVQARRREWEAAVGSATAPALLRQAGWSDQALESWLRDDLRIRAYVDQVFGAMSVPSRAEMLAYYDEHRSEYTKNGAVQDFDAVRTQVQRTLQDTKRAELVRTWADSLVKRATVR